MKTTIFNVGGQKFEITTSLLAKHPKCRLATLAAQNKGREVFLDRNPQAFAVVIDYIRYEKLLVPPSVCREVVLLQLRDLDIAHQDSTIVASASSSSSDPPPYYLSPTHSPASDLKSSSIPSTLRDATHSNLLTLTTSTFLPALRNHAAAGLRSMTFILGPTAISARDIVSDLPSSAVEVVSLEKLAVNVNFLKQDGVLSALEGMARDILSVRQARAKLSSVTVRKENDFGLFESCTMDVVQVAIDIV